MTYMGTLLDLKGQVFGRLEVLCRTENSAAGAARWLVRCVCGTKKEVRGSLLTNGLVVSCGCYAKEQSKKRNTTHGMTDTFEFNVWTAMRKRCNNPNHVRYHRYGGRGIKVCKRWEKFENFLADMGLCPYERGSIERVNNNKGYVPSNCKWLPRAEQSKNRNTSRKNHGNQRLQEGIQA